MGKTNRLTEDEKRAKLDKKLNQQLEDIIGRISGSSEFSLAGQKREQEIITLQLNNVKIAKEVVHYKPVKKEWPLWKTTKRWMKKINPILLFEILKKWFLNQ